MKTPLEVLDDALMIAYSHTTPRKPGAVIERLSPDKREILEQLTSDDLGKRRPDASY